LPPKWYPFSPPPTDAAITTAAGYPLDLTLYQSIKGVTAASHIMKPGGHILLIAACEEGVGAPEFRRMVLQGRADAEFLMHIENAPVTIDQWQLEKLALVRRLVSVRRLTCSPIARRARPAPSSETCWRRPPAGSFKWCWCWAVDRFIDDRVAVAFAYTIALRRAGGQLYRAREG
jgi:hypothetical protein